jgi:hypothetical protein
MVPNGCSLEIPSSDERRSALAVLQQRAARLAHCRWLLGLGIPKIFGIWPPLAPPPVTESSNNHGTMSYSQEKRRRMMRKSKLSKKQWSESARRASLARWTKKER